LIKEYSNKTRIFASPKCDCGMLGNGFMANDVMYIVGADNS